MALNPEKLLAYFVPLHQRAQEIVAAAELVNKHFPDAKGFINPALPPDYASFTSEGSAYMVRFSTCKIHYDSKSSKAPNPKYWFSQWTKEIDLTTPMRSTFIGYYDKKKKKDEPDDWRAKAAEAKKSKSENVDELLAATQVGARRTTSGADSFGANDSKPAAGVAPEQRSEPEPEPAAIKIDSLDDIKKLNLAQRKPKKAAKKKPKVAKVLPTKVIF